MVPIPLCSRSNCILYCPLLKIWTVDWELPFNINAIRDGAFFFGKSKSIKFDQNSHGLPPLFVHQESRYLERCIILSGLNELSQK